MNRKGKWIETFSGIKFWPFDPRPEEILVIDIAHALSNICRFNGHCKHFYSVSQHSINVSQELRKAGHNTKMQFYGLMHDAAEAYICDIPRPIKSLFKAYAKHEDRINKTILESFGLSVPTKEEKYIINFFTILCF